MPAIKPRPTPPLGHGGRVPTLIVRHPHYPDYNTLVKLPALDEGVTVNYNAALIICGIIADNSWSTGWFARSADGSNMCERGVPLAAANGDVFYFVDDPNSRTQVIPYRSRRPDAGIGSDPYSRSLTPVRSKVYLLLVLALVQLH